MRASLLSKLSDQGVAILAQVEETSQRVNQLLSPANQKDLMATIKTFWPGSGRQRAAAVGAGSNWPARWMAS
jgi:hypothetical protein